MTSGPRILIAGQSMWPWYQSACASALRELGCRVLSFDWQDEFHRPQPGRAEPVYKSPWAMLQNRLLWGPRVRDINRRLYRQALQERPDVIWFFNCMHVLPGTTRALRRALPGAVLVQYANDNPFGRHVRPDIWRHFKRSIPHCDVHFVYRRSNVEQFRRAGATEVHLLRSYYLPEEDFRVELGPGDGRYACDVVFAGHYEDDGRLAALERLAGSGISVNLFGGGWKRAERRLDRRDPLAERFPVTPVLGADYRKAIAGARIALCFLSKINGDTYTRRNFQIPAMQGFMLSEYSEDLAHLFEEGVEAEFFRSPDELYDKVRFYLGRPDLVAAVARRGHERVQKDGHDVVSRMRTFLEVVSPRVRDRREGRDAGR